MFSKYMFAGCLLGLVTILGPPAVAQTEVKGLLEALQLSAYPAGMTPPEFSGMTAAGRRVSLGSLRGRVVLLNFWATWCRECRPEMSAFEGLHRDFTAQGLTVLGINVREGRQAVQNYAKELGLTFPFLLDSKGEIHASYGVIGLPTTFLIGRDGRTVALAVGPREWGSEPARAIVQALLAESAGSMGAP